MKTCIVCDNAAIFTERGSAYRFFCGEPCQKTHFEEIGGILKSFYDTNNMSPTFFYEFMKRLDPDARADVLHEYLTDSESDPIAVKHVLQDYYDLHDIKPLMIEALAPAILKSYIELADYLRKDEKITLEKYGYFIASSKGLEAVRWFYKMGGNTGQLISEYPTRQNPLIALDTEVIGDLMPIFERVVVDLEMWKIRYVKSIALLNAWIRTNLNVRWDDGNAWYEGFILHRDLLITLTNISTTERKAFLLEFLLENGQYLFLKTIETYRLNQNHYVFVEPNQLRHWVENDKESVDVMSQFYEKHVFSRPDVDVKFKNHIRAREFVAIISSFKKKSDLQRWDIEAGVMAFVSNIQSDPTERLIERRIVYNFLVETDYEFLFKKLINKFVMKSSLLLDILSHPNFYDLKSIQNRPYVFDVIVKSYSNYVHSKRGFLQDLPQTPLSNEIIAHIFNEGIDTRYEKIWKNYIWYYRLPLFLLEKALHVFGKDFRHYVFHCPYNFVFLHMAMSDKLLKMLLEILHLDRISTLLEDLITGTDKKEGTLAAKIKDAATSTTDITRDPDGRFILYGAILMGNIDFVIKNVSVSLDKHVLLMFRLKRLRMLDMVFDSTKLSDVTYDILLKRAAKIYTLDNKMAVEYLLKKHDYGGKVINDLLSDVGISNDVRELLVSYRNNLSFSRKYLKEKYSE